MLTTEITLIAGKFTLELAATYAESDNLSYKKNRLGVTLMKYGIIPLVSLLLMLGTAQVWSDTEMKVATTQSGAPDSLYISNGKVYTAAEGHKIIIDPYQQSMTMMNVEKKEYMLIDEAFIDEISGMMSMMQDMMSQLPPGMLEQLPPEQREQILAQLGGGKGAKQAGTSTKPVIKNTGNSRKISGIACDDYTITDSAGEQIKACVASRGATNMNKEDYETLLQVGKFGMAFVEKISAAMPNMTDDIDISAMTGFDLPGVPMEVISDDVKTTISSISEKSIDLSSYDLSGYKQTQMPQMMGQ